MHKRAFSPPGYVITLISNICQESDSSRQARGELGLCSRGTEAEEATDPHSSISALIRETSEKNLLMQGREEIAEICQMSTFSGGAETLSVVQAVNHGHAGI